MLTAPRVVRVGHTYLGLGPFLKWAGGKRQLLPELLKEAPAKIKTYYEPFVGGGALFFALAAEGRFRRAVLADRNDDLIGCYQAIQSDVDQVIAALGTLVAGRDEYYAIRALNPPTLDPAMRAARLIYLNKVGFNGLYRVNSRGEFNVPYGHRKPLICDEPRLRAAAAALQGVALVCGDFAETVAAATAKDFVYFDPPYVPLSATSSFTAYAESPFGPKEQSRLAEVLRDLRKRKVPALLSNSDCETTRDLYRGLPEPLSVDVRRSINSVGSRRGPVKELLVKSFAF